MIRDTEPVFNKHIPNLSLEILHYLSDVPSNPSIGIRQNKVRILEGIGFSKGQNKAIVRDFNIANANNLLEFEEYILDQLNAEKTTAILFMKEEYSNVGGAPIVYINTPEDFQTNFHLNGEHPHAISQSGESVDMYSGDMIKTFSREKGTGIELENLYNKPGPQRVNLSGGLRMQLDNIRIHANDINFTWDCAASFDGYGPRVLTLSHENDYKVPRIHTNLEICYSDGQLRPIDIPKSEISEIRDARRVVPLLVSNLFSHQGVEITELLKSLLTIKPTLKFHSLTGIYIINDKGINTELIDFDGIDTVEAFNLPHDTRYKLPEKLLQSQLTRAGFIEKEIDSLKNYITHSKNLGAQLENLANSTDLSREMQERIQSSFSSEKSQYPNYPRELSGEVQLGRVLKHLNINWKSGDNEYIKTFERGKDKLILVDINGFSQAFWLCDCKLEDTRDIRRVRKQLSDSLGTNLVEAHFSYLREGD
jgi:hypothetical protein